MASKIERLLSLLNLLIGAERPFTAEEVRQRVPGYPADLASFQRQFERDKNDLRAMGLACNAEEIPGSYPIEFGYRMEAEQAHLRDPGLEPDELAALHLAASAIRLDGIEGSAGLWKLGGGAPVADGDRVVDLPTDSRLVTLFDAVAERRVVSFGYRGTKRTLNPWRLDCTRGRWYVTGLDIDHQEPRHYRLDRIEGSVTVGPPAGFERPDTSVDGVRLEPWQFGDGPSQVATVLVDNEYDEIFRQAAPTARTVETHTDGSTIHELDVTDLDAFRSLVLGLLDHVEILSPSAFREDLVSWLAALVEPASAP